MPTTRDDVRAALAVHDPAALRAILLAAKVRDGGDVDAAKLADRIAKAIWWHATTPIGYAAGRASLEDITQHVARRLDVQHRVAATSDAWAQLGQLTRALVSTLPDSPGIALSDVDSGMRERMKPHWKRAVAFGGGAGGSFGARAASGALLGFLKGPVGRWLPLFPPLAPYVRSVQAGAGAVHAITGPLGVALAVLSLNQALGPSYGKLLPLLLGVGALGVRPVEDAREGSSENSAEHAA